MEWIFVKLPFGKSVEPLVYIINAVSSGHGGIRDCETIEQIR